MKITIKQNWINIKNNKKDNILRINIFYKIDIIDTFLK
jgi:hypothetical protein